MRISSRCCGETHSTPSILPLMFVQIHHEKMPNHDAKANHRPARLAEASGNLSSIVAVDRAFPTGAVELGCAAKTHTVRLAILLLYLCWLIVGCAHQQAPQKAALIPPWRVVSDGVAKLVDQHAELSAFDRFRESSVKAEELHSFASVESITECGEFSAVERAHQREWFRSATSVWHYTFECQFAGILFVDSAGHVQHAILLG